VRLAPPARSQPRRCHSPLGVSHALRGFVLQRPCDHLQAADARRFRSRCPSGAQALIEPSPFRALILLEAVPARRRNLPSPTFPTRTAVPLPVVPDCERRVPEGLSLPESVPRIPAPCRASARSCSPGRFAPSWCSRQAASGVATLSVPGLSPLDGLAPLRPVGPPTSQNRCRGVARFRERRPPWRFGPLPTRAEA
jgi:hypothetical protein